MTRCKTDLSAAVSVIGLKDSRLLEKDALPLLCERIRCRREQRGLEQKAFTVGDETYIKHCAAGGPHSLNPGHAVLRFGERKSVCLIGHTASRQELPGSAGPEDCRTVPRAVR